MEIAHVVLLVLMFVLAVSCVACEYVRRSVWKELHRLRTLDALYTKQSKLMMLLSTACLARNVEQMEDLSRQLDDAHSEFMAV